MERVADLAVGLEASTCVARCEPQLDECKYVSRLRGVMWAWQWVVVVDGWIQMPSTINTSYSQKCGYCVCLIGFSGFE